MKKSIFISCLIYLFTADVIAQVTVKTDTLYSNSLNREVYVNVILPEGYDTTRTYPVFYLLHGYTGNHTDWVQRTGLRFYARNWPIIIIMPNGENSFYMNSVVRINDQFEDYIVDELPKLIQSRYRTNEELKGIGGLSMGGYGSIMLATIHSDKFIFGGSLSGAIVPWIMPEGVPELLSNSRVLGVLEPLLGKNPHPYYERYDLLSILSRHEGNKPYLFFAHGIQDSYKEFLPGHRIYTDKLRMMDWPYEYHETPGVHNWVYWDHHVIPMLNRFLKEVEKHSGK